MKIYKTTDNRYFSDEKDAQLHCSIFKKEIELLEKEGNNLKDSAFLNKMIVYEEIDLSDKEKIIDFLTDYNELVETVNALKEWVHFKDGRE